MKTIDQGRCRYIVSTDMFYLDSNESDEIYFWCTEQFGPIAFIWHYGVKTPNNTKRGKIPIFGLRFVNKEDALLYELTFK